MKKELPLEKAELFRDYTNELMLAMENHFKRCLNLKFSQKEMQYTMVMGLAVELTGFLRTLSPDQSDLLWNVFHNEYQRLMKIDFSEVMENANGH